MMSYDSGAIHGETQAKTYSSTTSLSYRYLAFRDFESIIKDKIGNRKALDLGCGTGISTHFLFEQGFDVIGVDISSNMLQTAKQSYPSLQFTMKNKMDLSTPFDLVLSSFVLFEIASKEKIIAYFNEAASYLSENGLFFAITGSEDMHQYHRNWTNFKVDYDENKKPQSGSKVKLRLKDPKIEFLDYYWTEADYKECFECSSLELIKLHYPLGRDDEAFEWKDELAISPIVIFLARKRLENF